MPIPSQLASLVNLRSLNLGSTQVADLAPLAGLKDLQMLNLADSAYGDISPLMGMGNLRELELGNINGHVEESEVDALQNRLRRCGIAYSWSYEPPPVPELSEEAVAALARLEELEIEVTMHADQPYAVSIQYVEEPSEAISLLPALISLKGVSVWNSPLTEEDMATLGELTFLEWFSLYEAGVTGISPLAGMTSLKTLSIFHDSRRGSLSAGWYDQVGDAQHFRGAYRGYLCPGKHDQADRP